VHLFAQLTKFVAATTVTTPHCCSKQAHKPASAVEPLLALPVKPFRMLHVQVLVDTATAFIFHQLLPTLHEQEHFTVNGTFAHAVQRELHITLTS
jgi:hypothetical protein